MEDNMGNAEDLTGKRYGRLVVIGRAKNNGKRVMWRCRCDCGNEKVVRADGLKCGSTRSCGCLGNEVRLNNWKPYNKSSVEDDDIVGKRFGKLTVLEYAGKDKHRCKLFRCVCDCGKETITRKSRIIDGTVKSCGCMSSDVWSKMTYKHGYARHGEYNRLYAIWSHMIDRCHNPKNPSYRNYGKRGITVCDEWKNDVNSFMEWANKNGYSDNLSIDRIDNNKGYSPDNCRWADRETQGNNKRNNIVLEYHGERKTITQWSKIIGISRGTLAGRYYSGWSVEKILTEPLHNNCKQRKGGD